MTATDVLRKRSFAVPVVQAQVAAEWRRRGYSCGEFRDPPGRAWRDFVHDCNELVTVVSGRLQLEVGGASVVVEPGDEVFIARGELHSVVNIHDSQTVWLYGYD